MWRRARRTTITLTVPQKLPGSAARLVNSILHLHFTSLSRTCLDVRNFRRASWTCSIFPYYAIHSTTLCSHGLYTGPKLNLQRNLTDAHPTPCRSWIHLGELAAQHTAVVIVLDPWFPWSIVRFDAEHVRGLSWVAICLSGRAHQEFCGV